MSYSAAYEHLRSIDPTWGRIIDTVGECRLQERRRPTNYEALVRILIGQQISVSAAASIFARVCEPFGGTPPAPVQVLAMSDEELRGLGLSRPKASYLRHLAEEIESGRFDPDALGGLDDEQAVERLTGLRGIGIWSAEVFLMFQLGRPDVFPAGDLGLQRAAALAWGLDERPSEAALRQRAEPWRPWRSVAGWYLWQSLTSTPLPAPEPLA